MIPLVILLLIMGFAVTMLLFTFPAAVAVFAALAMWRVAARRRRHRSDAFVRAMLDS